jgi:hypothetical protein
MGTLTGAKAGEVVRFTSATVSGLLPGTANNAGQIPLRWQCQPSEAGARWQVTATGSSGGSVTFTVTGKGPAAPPPVAQPPAQATKGFHVEDTFLGGTWARRDPNNGTWYNKSTRPANAAYWFNNGLGIGVDCARSAAGYVVKFASGATQTWSWWLHVTDNTWIPAAAVTESSGDGDQGVAHC